jgi:uncharacterized protein DUF4160
MALKTGMPRTMSDEPRRALALTLEWAREHRDELMEDWNLCRQRQSPKTIEPLR